MVQELENSKHQCIDVDEDVSRNLRKRHVFVSSVEDPVALEVQRYFFFI